MMGWIGVDLDGTLAEYNGWKGPHHIGSPIPEMLPRVREWLALGRDVRIFTARVAFEANDGVSRDEIINIIEEWCSLHIGVRLQVTCIKDFGMVELWDDRCIQVIPNTGKRADGKSD